MYSLEQQIRNSAQELQGAWASVNAASSSNPLIRACAAQWIKQTSFYEVLASTADPMPLREEAWLRLEALSLSCNEQTGDRVTMDGRELSFNAARHFALLTYQATAWSIYDRLANICGRIAACPKVAHEPKQNPKLCETLLGNKELLGFGGKEVLRAAYEWPAKISYKVRNWLVHEGYEEGTTLMFAGDDLTDGFALHADAVIYLENCCKRGDGGADHRICIPDTGDEWPTQDLLAILEQYNRQLDLMFVSFLEWTVSSLCKQIQAFPTPHCST